MDAERRQYRRFRVDNKDISTKTLFAAEAELLNISVGGACVRAGQSLKEAGKRLVKLESGTAPLKLPCSVVWEDVISDVAGQSEKSLSAYRTGVSFIDLPPDKLVGLKDFIRESGVPFEQRVSDVHKPSSLRFQVRTNKRAVVYYTKTLRVRKIGLGGMLIETDGWVQPGKVFPMELFIPNEGPPIRFLGRIASSLRTSTEEQGDRFDIGVEFLDIPITDKFRLSAFLLFAKIPGE